jgi:hypothetical protein
MSSFELGKIVYSGQGAKAASRWLTSASRLSGPISKGLFATGVATAAAAPFTPILSTAASVLGTLYGAKLVYDGVKTVF